jgi:hypothetical protein
VSVRVCVCMVCKVGEFIERKVAKNRASRAGRDPKRVSNVTILKLEVH